MQLNNILATLHNSKQTQCGVFASFKRFFFSGINYLVAITVHKNINNAINIKNGHIQLDIRSPKDIITNE